MKAKSFISFAVCVAVSVLMCSCSNEESADSNNNSNSNSNSNGQLTAFTGGIATEAPMERMQLSTPEISTEVPGFLTRTSMNRNDIGGQGVFYWERGDVIYVEDDKGKLCKSQNEITESAPRTTFLVDGSYTGKNQYDVYYYGTNTNTSASAKKVVIADKQTQVAFNNTKHFGAAGDCGVAKATKTTVEGKSGYRFDLAHKASYLCFLPYIPSQQERSNFKIKRIEITSETDNISGTYDLKQDGLSGTGNFKTITLNVGTDGNGLELADKSTETKSINNSLYVVIAPGERKLSVKYTVFSVKDNKELTLTKSYPLHNFAVNQICDIPVSLDESDIFKYSGHNYYMWDAKENYWSGHEWDSDAPWQRKDGKKDLHYPKSKSADGARWYNEEGDIGASIGASNPLFKKLPNSQELAWYVLKGDAHWDNTTKWKAFGRTCTGGIWLKKLSVIAQEVGKSLSYLKQYYPDGINREGADFWKECPILKSGKPDKKDDYFFLPALGSYMDGALYNLGKGGLYWSSSSALSSKEKAYSLFFSIEGERVMKFGSNSYRNNGCVAYPFK